MVTTRNLEERDLPDVLRIQRESFDDAKLESRSSFVAKLAASPSTCFVALEGPAVVGYLFAIPADSREPPSLNDDRCDVPRAPDCLYLHDLSVSKEARGAGVADALVAAFLSQMQRLGFTRACLTAVNDSADYWARHGFRVAGSSELAPGRLATYGEGARYMILDLVPRGP